MITGITPGTGASSVLANISAGSGTVKVLKADGTENTGASEQVIKLQYMQMEHW